MELRLEPRYKPFLEQHLSNMVWKFRWQTMVQRDLEHILTNTIPQRNYAITTPPRHGKTSLVTIPLPAYFLRHNTQSEVIVAMHSQGIANKVSRRTRKIAKDDIGISDEAANVKEWETAQGGRYRAVGAGGYIAGTGGDLLIADDLIPDRKKAESELFRQNLHDWWQDDFITRRNPQPGRGFAPVVIIMTRWHTDDIWGRVVNPDEWLIRRLPAICDYDPADIDSGEPCPLGRINGQALAPGMWTLENLLNIKAGMSEYSWQALYQGRPTSKTGLFFDVSVWGPLSELVFHHTNTDDYVERRVRYFDFAASSDQDAAYTATVLMCMHRSGQMTIEHMDRIQADPGKRDRWQKRMADADAIRFGEGNVRQIEEKQPGAAGKDRVRAFHTLMAGHTMAVDKIEGEGSKTTRADPFAASVSAGLVNLLITSPFGTPNPIDAFKSELKAFPLGKYKDWVDAGSGAHNWLTRAGVGSIVAGARASRTERLRRHARRR